MAELSRLPVPVADAFRASQSDAGYPELGEANDLMEANK